MRYLLFALLLSIQSAAFTQISLSSPDKRITVKIGNSIPLTYTVSFQGKPILSPSRIDLTVANNKRLQQQSTPKITSRRTVDSVIISPVPEKRKRITDKFNELTIAVSNQLSVVFRAYDDGVAYRIRTNFKDSLYIGNEIAEFNLQPQQVFFSTLVKKEGLDRFHTSFEEPYSIIRSDTLPRDALSYTPVLVGDSASPKIVITESDLEDYPGMFLAAGSTNQLKGVFAPYPLEVKATEGEYPQEVVTRRASYIAKIAGKRKLPWRVLMIAASDKELPSNDIVYRLASPSRVSDPSWIKPGKGTDEWIIGINLFNVPFKSGVNTDTYKFYIDFAKKFGFDRIMMDAGWSDYKDLFKINPAIDMNEISRYAKQQGISLSMWTLAMTLDRQLEAALDQFSKWGVDFIMTDFMDRDDQKMVNFYFRVAEACARKKIMVMYHGAFKPAGFNRTFPNAVTREGVLGSEYNMWSHKADPEHNVQLPFIRMTSGPMDYEPGLLENANRKTFRTIEDNVMSRGTRCHQLAMFVVYESPIQLFSGNPSQGLLEPQFMQLLGSVPTTWDETKIIEGKVGDYIITARKKGDNWFVGGMTDWSERTFDIQFNFLDDGEYEVELCVDGVNADRYAADYRIEKFSMKKGDKKNIRMAPGGGFMMRLRKI
jgi:alpha-glucosidase